MDFVTVARFSNSFDMHVIKFRLENEGIECFVRDEHTITANPLYDIPMGGIKLQVMEKDLEAAREILKDASYNDSGSISTFNIFSKTQNETSPLRIVLLVVFALLMLLLFI